jgi:NAD(P)H dehydrogenase (quinone)
MAPIVVVVTFYSRTGATERLATAAAVGAVQARAGIRMRRLAEIDLAATLVRHPDAREPVDRMLKEYVPPREADVLSADALVVALPAGMKPESGECAQYFDMLSKLHIAGKLSGKAAAVVGTHPSRDAIASMLRSMGVPVVMTEETSGGDDDVEQAVALGRQVVSVAESLRTAPG